MDSPRPLTELKAWIEANTTQAAFARAAGCSKGYLSELLKGEKTNISLSVARRLSAATGGTVPITAIMRIDETAAQGAAP